jgi:hypothetical protein
MKTLVLGISLLVSISANAAESIQCQYSYESGVIIKIGEATNIGSSTTEYFAQVAFYHPTRVENAPIEFQNATLSDTPIQTRLVTGDQYEIKVSNGATLSIRNEVYPAEQSSLSSFTGTYTLDGTSMPLTCEYTQSEEQALIMDAQTADIGSSVKEMTEQKAGNIGAHDSAEPCDAPRLCGLHVCHCL